MSNFVRLPNGVMVLHHTLWTHVRNAKRTLDLDYCGRQLLCFLPPDERKALSDWATRQARADQGKDYHIWAVIPLLYSANHRKKLDPSHDAQYLFYQIQRKQSAQGILF